MLTPNDFTSLDEVAERILGFQSNYQAIASPFEWTFTRQDLKRLLARLQKQAALRPAA